MSILEQNFNRACEAMADLVNKEKKENAMNTAPFIIVQVAHHEESFEFFSASLTPAENNTLPRELAEDKYYNMVFIADGIDDVTGKFRDKYLFKLASADVRFALHTAYRLALMSETGEYTLNTSFFRPAIEDSAWAYNDVFHYSDLGQFRCWLNFDDEFKQVNIQADNDFIEGYDKLITQSPARA